MRGKSRRKVASVWQKNTKKDSIHREVGGQVSTRGKYFIMEAEVGEERKRKESEW